MMCLPDFINTITKIKCSSLGGCPRIERLLRKAEFGQLFLATASILEQPHRNVCGIT